MLDSPQKEKNQRCSDETLSQMATLGDTSAEEELIGRYARLVRICARPLFLVGGDSEDLIQEGMLGLLGAVRAFDHTRNVTFRTFAETCIRNRLTSAIKAALRTKHKPLNDSVSIETPQFDSNEVYHSTLKLSPEDLIIGQEEKRELLNRLKNQLSPLEAEILPHYLDGFSCAEIAHTVGKSPKSVDNAVQRIRKKLVRLYQDGASSES